MFYFFEICDISLCVWFDELVNMLWNVFVLILLSNLIKNILMLEVRIYEKNVFIDRFKSSLL